MGVEAAPWKSEDDITEHAAAEDFQAGGFTVDEAEALLFTLTQVDRFGAAVNSVEMIDRYFSYSL